MAKNQPIDVKKIIATNPRINAAELEKGLEALKKLQQTGVVKPSTYSLETPDSKRTLQYCDDFLNSKQH